MGIQNRSLDASEQKTSYHGNFLTTATGSNYMLFQAPHPMTLDQVKASALGLSGTPTAQLKIQRFVTGAGLTVIPIGPALTHGALGTSGPQAFVISSSALQAGDILTVTTAGTNAGVDQLLIDAQVQATQDIKSWY